MPPVDFLKVFQARGAVGDLNMQRLCMKSQDNVAEITIILRSVLSFFPLAYLSCFTVSSMRLNFLHIGYKIKTCMMPYLALTSSLSFPHCICKTSDILYSRCYLSSIRYSKGIFQSQNNPT